MRELTSTLVAAQKAESLDLPYFRLTFSLRGWLNNGTGVATGYPVDLAIGDTVVAVTTVGTFTIFIPTGLTGTVSGDGTCNVTDDPKTLTPGANTTITTSGAAGNITITLAGTADVVIEQDRIWYITGTETTANQPVGIIFDNSDGYFTSLDLKGWQVVIERGLMTTAGIEYDALPPMKVMAMNFDSRPAILRCTMSCIGIPDRLNKDKASKSYYNHWSCTKTVKSLITEIASGVPVDAELTEEQTDGGSYLTISALIPTLAGERLSMPQRTITKLAFKLKKVGAPSGNVTFTLWEASGGSILATKTFPCSSIPLSVAVMCEAALTTPIEVNLPITFTDDGDMSGGAWITVDYQLGDALNYVQVAYSGVRIKPEQAFIEGEAGSPDVTWEDQSRGCVYRYKYTPATGADNGVDCFTHCQPYAVVYDPDPPTDTLIDSYMPAGGFTINKGSSRLEAINKLLDFTGCNKIVKTDGKIHIFVSTITGTQAWASPTGHVDGDDIWADEALAYDGNTTTFAYTTLAKDTWGSYLQLSHASLKCSKLRYFASIDNDTPPVTDKMIDLDVYYDGAWHDIFQGTLTESAWVEHELGGIYTATAARVRFKYSGGFIVEQAKLYEFAFYNAVYDYEYSLGSGVHVFLSKALRNSLVDPNKVTVSDDTYEGSATDATSYALQPIEDFLTATLTSNAQATSIAEAMIAQAVMNGQRGKATCPINLGAEIYDYVKVTDSRQSDSRVGNLGYIKWWWDRLASEYNMTFSFGNLIPKAIGGWVHHSDKRTFDQDVSDFMEEKTIGDLERDDDIEELKKRPEYKVDDDVSDAIDKKHVQGTDAHDHVQGTDTTLGAMTAAIDMNGQQINKVPKIDIWSGADEIGWLYSLALIFLLKAKTGHDVEIMGGSDTAYPRIIAYSSGILSLASGDGQEVDIVSASGVIDVNTSKISNVVDPTSGQDAATKNYHDTNDGVRNSAVSYTLLSNNTLYQNTGDYDQLLIVTGHVSGISSIWINIGPTSTPADTVAVGNNDVLTADEAKVIVAVIPKNYYYKIQISGGGSIQSTTLFTLGS